MINILLITHGPLARALVDTSDLIMGSNTDIHILSLNHGDDPETFKLEVFETIDKLNNEEGLLIFTDLFGGTPANAVMEKLFELKFPEHIVCYTGANLPIILEGIAMSSAGEITSVKDSIDGVMASTISNLSDQFRKKVSQ